MGCTVLKKKKEKERKRKEMLVQNFSLNHSTGKSQTQTHWKQSRISVQCWKFLSPGRPRRSGLGLGDLFLEVGSPGGQPEMAIYQLLRGPHTPMTTQSAVQWAV